MLASITPLGERGRGARWSRTVSSYVVGSAVGGGAFGAVLGAVGARVLSPSRAVLLVVVAVGAAVAAVLDVTRRVPTIRRQVDENWLVTYRDWVYGAGFGLQLGLGAVTIVTSATVYLTWLLELLSGGAAAGALVGVTFGIARALPLLTFAGVDSPARLRARHRTVARLTPIARGVTVGSALVVAGVASLLAVS